MAMRKCFQVLQSVCPYYKNYVHQDIILVGCLSPTFLVLKGRGGWGLTRVQLRIFVYTTFVSSVNLRSEDNNPSTKAIKWLRKLQWLLYNCQGYAYWGMHSNCDNDDPLGKEMKDAYFNPHFHSFYLNVMQERRMLESSIWFLALLALKVMHSVRATHAGKSHTPLML